MIVDIVVNQLLLKTACGSNRTMNIFVFGSNLAGRHGKGAALHAKLHYGAIVGRGVGRQGNSYAIPTKDYRCVASWQQRD